MSGPDRRRLCLAGLALAAVPAVLGGCAWLPRDAAVPMPTTSIPAACDTAGRARRAPVLLVLLPGAYSLPAQFLDEGFVAALRRTGADADVVIADAHLGYFGNGSFEQRLRQDVIEPARRLGYQRIWLVGISLGGFGALAYAATHGNRPPGVDGIVAIAPYLGGQRLLSEVEAAGGAVAWAATQPPVQDGRVTPFGEAGASDDAVRGIWRWLAWQARASTFAAETAGSGSVPIYLGYGTEDRLAQGHRLLAGLLPPGQVLQATGGHDWPPWREVWQRWLALGLLPVLPAALAGACEPKGVRSLR